MEQASPVERNEGKHAKFKKKVDKDRMKCKKSQRHSSKLHFHRDLCFQSQALLNKYFPTTSRLKLHRKTH